MNTDVEIIFLFLFCAYKGPTQSPIIGQKPNLIPFKDSSSDLTPKPAKDSDPMLSLKVSVKSNIGEYFC